MVKKMCSIFNCDRHRENRCCFTCLDYNRCANRCLNSPSLCGLAKDSNPKKERSAKGAHRRKNGGNDEPTD